MSAAGVAIRRLCAADVRLLRDLNALFAREFADPQTYGGDKPSDAYVESLLGRDHVFALTAIDGDELIGGLVAYELPKLERARSELYIYDLAVAERRRRQGVATALIERLRELAADRGAWVIYVQADHGDDAAIALYTKLGLREDVMHFDIAVNFAEIANDP